jgi:release factor glutamine methyltransferase
MTLAETLRDAAERLRAADVDDARLEAEALLAFALDATREWLLARLQEPLSPEERTVFGALLERRLAREPTAYIVGHKEFYGLELDCTPAALIPRPETELLVEHAIASLRRPIRNPDSAQERTKRRRLPAHVELPLIADVGTGNGAIAVALALHLPEGRLIAIDTSRPALELARRNAHAHGVAGRVSVVQGTLLAPLRGRFDLIVANLPYVPTQTYRNLPPEIQEHEPETALHAGRRGTALVEELLAQAPSLLRGEGLLLAEHGWNQGRRLREAARAAFPGARVETKRDLAGIDRMLVVRRGQPETKSRSNRGVARRPRPQVSSVPAGSACPPS